MALLLAVLVLVLGLLGSAAISSIQRTCRIDPITVEFGSIALSEVSWSHEFKIEKPEIIVVGPSPEDLAVDSSGNVYTGMKDGWIKRIRVDGAVENFTHHDGPILGIAAGPDDSIYFADADQGLFVVSKDGTEKLLSTEADGTAMRFTDGVAVTKDGTVYFTDASSKFGLDDYLLDIMEGRPNGRLLKYDPSTSSTTVLAKELAFANGVALSEDEDFLLVCETSRALIHRYWLKGEKAGTLEPFVENLPGYPDNIRWSVPDKVFYVALAAVRNKNLEWAMTSPSKFLRCFLVHPVGLAITPKSGPGLLATVTPEGKLESKFHDPKGQLLTHVTGGMKVGDFVYFTFLRKDFIVRIKL